MTLLSNNELEQQPRDHAQMIRADKTGQSEDYFVDVTALWKDRAEEAKRCAQETKDESSWLSPSRWWRELTKQDDCNDRMMWPNAQFDFKKIKDIDTKVVDQAMGIHSLVADTLMDDFKLGSPQQREQLGKIKAQMLFDELSRLSPEGLKELNDTYKTLYNMSLTEAISRDKTIPFEAKYKLYKVLNDIPAAVYIILPEYPERPTLHGPYPLRPDFPISWRPQTPGWETQDTYEMTRR